MTHALPFRRFTKLMTASMVKSSTYWLNSFPSQNGILANVSPAAIVTGRGAPDFKYNNIVFGSYAMVHLGTNNTMKPRSVPGIALGPSNEWGGQFFMSLFSGKRLHSYKYTELPIDDEVIRRVDELAKKEDQAEMPGGFPLFEWDIGVPVTDAHNEDIAGEAGDVDTQENIIEYGDDNREGEAVQQLQEHDSMEVDNGAPNIIEDEADVEEVVPDPQQEGIPMERSIPYITDESSIEYAEDEGANEYGAMEEGSNEWFFDDRSQDTT